MRQIALVFFSLSLLLAEPCLADSTTTVPTATPAVPAGMTGDPQQRMQSFQAMSPAQRQAAMQTMKTSMQSKMQQNGGSGSQGMMGSMRSRMRARMGAGMPGGMSSGSTAQ